MRHELSLTLRSDSRINRRREAPILGREARGPQSRIRQWSVEHHATSQPVGGWGLDVGRGRCTDREEELLLQVRGRRRPSFPAIPLNELKGRPHTHHHGDRTRGGRQATQWVFVGDGLFLDGDTIGGFFFFGWPPVRCSRCPVDRLAACVWLQEALAKKDNVSTARSASANHEPRGLGRGPDDEGSVQSKSGDESKGEG